MDNNNVLLSFGMRVRKLRKVKNLSQEELASLSNLHRTYIGMIERAEKNVTLVNIEKIANGLQISIHELMMFNELARKDNQVL